MQETAVEQVTSLIESRNEDLKSKKMQARAMKPKTLMRRMWDFVRGRGGGGGARPVVLPPDGKGE